MRYRILHTALLALLIAPTAWAGANDVKAEDLAGHNFAAAAAAGGNRPADTSGVDLTKLLEEKLRPVNTYAGAVEVVLNLQNGILGRNKPLGNADAFCEEVRKYMPNKPTGASDNCVSEYNRLRDESITAFKTKADNQGTNASAMMTEAIRMVSFAVSSGSPNLNEVQFISRVQGPNGAATPQFNLPLIAEKATEVLNYIAREKGQTLATQFASNKEAKAAIAQALVFIKGMINVSKGINPSDPQGPKIPAGQFPPNPFAGNGSGQGGQPQGSDGGKKDGGGDGKGGGQPPGGGAQAQHSQIPQLQAPEIAKLNGMIDQNFAGKLLGGGPPQEFNVANGNNLSPPGQRGRPLDSSAVGALVGDLNNYGQMISAQYSGLNPYRNQAPPPQPKQFRSTATGVREAEEEQRPRTNSGASGVFAGILNNRPPGPSSMVNAGAVRPGPGAGTRGAIGGDTFAMATTGNPGGRLNRGGPQSGPRRLKGKYEGADGVREFVRANPGVPVLTGNPTSYQ